MSFSTYLTVSPTWLHLHLKDKNILILDATQQKNSDSEIAIFAGIQIPNTIKFDIKSTFSDTQNPFPNTLPTAANFEKSCQELGVNSNSRIVVYDKLGVFSSPRVWWMFRAMGHHNIVVLDGGLPEWILCNFPTENSNQRKSKKGNFKANLDSSYIRYIDQIKQNINTKKELVIDVRSFKRFQCLVPETRAGLRSGTIKNSINLPYSNVLEHGKFKSINELGKILKKLPKNKALIFTCGSGITACIVYLACMMVMDNKIAIYDGSWTEWGTLTK